MSNTSYDEMMCANLAGKAMAEFICRFDSYHTCHVVKEQSSEREFYEYERSGIESTASK